MKGQMPLPGLESPVKPSGEKATGLVDLEKRILALELEVSLLRILLERGES